MRSSIRDLSLFDFVVIPLCVACSVHEASIGSWAPSGRVPAREPTWKRSAPRTLARGSGSGSRYRIRQ